MKRFFQLIISAIVIGILCLMISHWFKSKIIPTQMRSYMFTIGENILILA